MAMLPILLVVSFVAPHAWGDQSAPAAVPGVTVEQAAIPAVQANPAVSVEQAVPVEMRRRAVAPRERPRVEVPVRARVAIQPTERPRVRTVTPRPSRAMTRTIEREVPVETRAREVRAAQSADASRRAEEARTAISARRAELEIQSEQVTARHEIASLQAQLRRHERELERSKELVEKGLATRQTHATAEEQVAHARRQLESARAQHALMEQEHDLRRREVQVDRRAQVEARVVQRERAEHLNLPGLDASATLQAQDELTITIADEPDLPTHFTVRADGSIRFPLLGSVRVQGSTTTQVQSAIQKLIRDKGLAGNPSVTVSARRGR